MKIIVIMGPHGAGKDTIIQKVLEFYDKERPGLISKALYTTTRARRSDEVAGRDALFATEQELFAKKQKGELVAFAKVSDYYCGTTLEEHRKSPVVITNVLYSCIPQFYEKFEDEGLKLLKIYINSPKEQRKARIKNRNPEITDDQLDYKLNHDSNAVSSEDLTQMDLVVENKDGELHTALASIVQQIRDFI